MSRMASSSSTISTLAVIVGFRQLYPHGGPDALLGADRDLPSHPLHELLTDRQPEANAAGGVSPRRIEAFEEVGEVLFGDASGLVLDGHRCPGEAQPHHLAGAGMLDSVGYGDQERLLEQRGIGDDRRCL